MKKANQALNCLLPGKVGTDDCRFFPEKVEFSLGNEYNDTIIQLEKSDCA